MRLICIFKGTKLLEHSSFFNPLAVETFKETVAAQSGLDILDLDAVEFEDADLDAYIKPSGLNPRRKAEITKDKITLFDLIDSPTTAVVKLNWMACSEEEITAEFSPEDQVKIAANKAYLDGLGPEKYQTGFEFEWPYIVDGPDVTLASSEIVSQIKKEIIGQAL